jgi:hypothetical protein
MQMHRSFFYLQIILSEDFYLQITCKYFQVGCHNHLHVSEVETILLVHHANETLEGALLFFVLLRLIGEKAHQAVLIEGIIAVVYIFVYVSEFFPGHFFG